MKFLSSLFCFFLFSFGLCAQNYSLEVRTACFSPTSKDVKDTYSRAWIDLEVFASKKISEHWEIWGEVDWAIKRGHTSRGYYGFKDRTRAWLLPISAGLRYLYAFNCRIQGYVGAGLSYSFLKIDNRFEDYDYSFYSSTPFKKHIYKSTPGGLVKAGLLIDTCDNTFIDLFVDYIWQDFHLGHHNIFEERAFGHHFNASGFKIGGGFGVRF